MSTGYNARLKKRAYKASAPSQAAVMISIHASIQGLCGDDELYDDDTEVARKVQGHLAVELPMFHLVFAG